MKQATLRVIAIGAFMAPLLAACAGDSSRYPSLAIRDAERLNSQSSQAATSDVTQLSADAIQSVAASVNQARDSHAQFTSRQPSALALARAAKGQSNESDLLAQAMIAAAQLSTLRGETNVALSKLDALEAQAASDFIDTQAIKSAQAEILQMLAVQDAEIAAVRQAMR